MNYFRSYSPSPDAGIVAAWDSQVAAVDEIPSLRQILLERSTEVFPEFSKRYSEIRALPRSARRALQRKLASSRNLANIPQEWRRKLAYSLAGAALLLALSQGVAQAGSMMVNVKSPEINPSDGLCSLKEAIVAANNHSTYADCVATSGPNTIFLPPGTQAITTYHESYAGQIGLPAITSTITIEGNGAKITRKSTNHFRLFAVKSSGDLTLKNVTLSGGYSSNNGGAILNAGDLSIENSIITGNRANNDGGGIANEGGTLHIDPSTISKNIAGSNGGGLTNYGGHVVLIDTLITGNKAAGTGGGIYNKDGYLKTESSNHPYFGTTITKNTAVDSGAGIYDRNGETYIYYTLITGNKSAHFGGGIYSRSGGELAIRRTGIYKNSAQYGGGIDLFGSGVLITLSGIKGNKVTGAGGGIGSAGGAEIIVNDSDITGNSAAKFGGGVENHYSTFTMNNSVITGNKAGIRGGGVDNSGASFKFFSTGILPYGNKAKTDPNISYNP